MSEALPPNLYSLSVQTLVAEIVTAMTNTFEEVHDTASSHIRAEWENIVQRLKEGFMRSKGISVLWTTWSAYRM